jgi:hypothetical protein
MEGKFDMGGLDVSLNPGTHISTQVRTLHLIGGISLYF